MKKFLLFLVLVLALCAGVLYFGFMPRPFYEFVDEHAPTPVSDIVNRISQNRRADSPALDLPQPLRQFAPMPDDVAVRQLHDITRRVIEGVLALEHPIVIPLTLPPGDDEQITDYFIEHVELAVDIIRRDIPAVFWLSLETYRIEWSGNMATRSGILTVYLNYRHAEREVERLSAQMWEVIDNIIQSAPDNPLEKITFFHDWIVNNTVYAAYLAEGNGVIQGYEHGFNIDGVFLRGSAVCEGYSKAFKLLSDIAGIPNIIVYGVAKDENHSWNYVMLEGQWYLVDVTWNDPVGEEDILLHTFFLLGSESVVDGFTVSEIFTEDDAEYPTLARTGFFE